MKGTKRCHFYMKNVLVTEQNETLQSDYSLTLGSIEHCDKLEEHIPRLFTSLFPFDDCNQFGALIFN